jgi:putative flippase GtrA
MTHLVAARASFVDPARRAALLRFATDLVKYGFASVAGLATDYGLLIALTKQFGVDYLVAAPIGFLSGLVLVYWLSVHFVFGDRRKLERRAEIMGFLLTGLLGLALNEALLFLFVGKLCLGVTLAKIPTAGCVFAFNFLTRRTLIFSTGAESGAVDA